ncbi:PREDICTED: uncharacterized protein LOC109228265 isoform X2 [Nicotiana attenuata]|uniref:uncharacterized protein LOC109228265 isoform X2 n=1 Tax=Nicotiana attenuata TaxID=49451 RepID=UPI0009048704|nr:PREDICTED: uncharacterized protein LOC109228265 isoform X2 [Nicotiana attenuata]
MGQTITRICLLSIFKRNESCEVRIPIIERSRRQELLWANPLWGYRNGIRAGSPRKSRQEEEDCREWQCWMLQSTLKLIIPPLISTEICVWTYIPCPMSFNWKEKFGRATKHYWAKVCKIKIIGLF